MKAGGHHHHPLRTPGRPRQPIMRWLPFLLQTTDSLFPTGAYAHSSGLESLVQLGLVTDAPTLAAFLRTHALPALARYELPYLGFAREAAARGDLPTLVALDREYGAGKLAREAREASAGIGMQRLRMLLRLETLLAAAPGRGGQPGGAGGCAGVRGGSRVRRGPWPRGGGLRGAGRGCWACLWMAAMFAYGYGSLAGFGSAALKLIRIGQEGVQGGARRRARADGENRPHGARRRAGGCRLERSGVGNRCRPPRARVRPAVHFVEASRTADRHRQPVVVACPRPSLDCPLTILRASPSSGRTRRPR